VAPSPCIISGATAEWIMERPNPYGSTSSIPYDLPAYTDFSFTQCVAQSTLPGGAAPQDHDLQAAKLIRMYDRPATGGVRTIATAARLSNQEIQCSYVPP
jgi:hypothetical protein